MALNAPYTPSTVIQSTQVSNDLTGLANGSNDTATNSMSTYRSESNFDYVASGGVWSGDSYGVNRNGSMTASVVYIAGVRLAVSAVTGHAFTASKDTYVDINGSGVPVYTEATNNAASAALTAGSLRIAIIITGATTIAAATSVNQGQETMVLPVASSINYSVTDSLGNLICPRDVNRKVLLVRQATGALNSLGTTSTLMPGLSGTVIAPTGRKLMIEVYIPVAQMSVAGAVTVEIYNSATVTGSPIQSHTLYMPTTGTGHTHRPTIEITLSGTQSFCVGIKASTAGSGTIAANSTGFINELRVKID